MRRNWESSSLPTADGAGGPHREAERRTSVTHGLEKSDRRTVPNKPSNKAERSVAEKAEASSLAQGHPRQGDTTRRQSRAKVNRALGRIRQAAARNRQAKFTSLLHHIYLLRGPAAGGVLQPQAGCRTGR